MTGKMRAFRAECGIAVLNVIETHPPVNYNQ